MSQSPEKKTKIEGEVTLLGSKVRARLADPPLRTATNFFKVSPGRKKVSLTRGNNKRPSTSAVAQ